MRGDGRERRGKKIRARWASGRASGRARRRGVGQFGAHSQTAPRHRSAEIGGLGGGEPTHKGLVEAASLLLAGSGGRRRLGGLGGRGSGTLLLDDLGLLVARGLDGVGRSRCRHGGWSVGVGDAGGVEAGPESEREREGGEGEIQAATDAGASADATNESRKRGVARAQKHSTRADFGPRVDSTRFQDSEGSEKLRVLMYRRTSNQASVGCRERREGAAACARRPEVG